MNGIERMACPECGTENPMLGVVEGTRQYLCRKCGQAYYTPDSCLGSSGDLDRMKEEPGPKSPARPDAPPKTKPDA
jgi:transposase-like protein